MVRTGTRARSLAALLERGGLRAGGTPPPAPRLADLPEELARSVLSLYRALGGASASPSLRPGGWDLALADGTLVELDEELHFNRYRRLTLETDWAKQLPWHDDYLRFCDSEEAACLQAGTWGKRWTNPSCEAMFGAAGRPGDLNAGSAPRWKQRALYDAVKDAYAASLRGARVARVSVHDRLDGRTLGDALKGVTQADPTEVALLVRKRTVGRTT